MSADEPFSQSAYKCRLEWGTRGAAAAAERGDIIVIVDVLSFTTCVVTATYYGGRIIPCNDLEDAVRTANEVGAVVAGAREAEPKRGHYSLSPRSYLGVKTGTVIAVSSPNGGTCTRSAQSDTIILAGALVNASTTAWAVQRAHSRTGRRVTVVPCGERWAESSKEAPLRFSVEDYLAAGAILSGISLDKSPEAWICSGAFDRASTRLEQALWECASGHELRDRGFGADVRFASQLDFYATASLLRDGAFVAIEDETELGKRR